MEDLEKCTMLNSIFKYQNNSNDCCSSNLHCDNLLETADYFLSEIYMKNFDKSG